MELSLADVARIVAAGGARAEMLLSEFAKERDQRYTREKRAFQSALLLLRDAPRSDSLPVEERTRPAMTVLVRPFMADRGHFYERLRAEADSAHSWLRQVGVRRTAGSFCRLIRPPAEEEARLGLLLNVEARPGCPDEIPLRRLPARSCAVIGTGGSSIQASDLSAPLDAI